MCVLFTVMAESFLAQCRAYVDEGRARRIKGELTCTTATIILWLIDCKNVE